MGNISLTEIINDPDSSAWLRNTAQSALGMDAVESAREAQLLEKALRERAEGVLGGPRSLAAVG